MLVDRFQKKVFEDTLEEFKDRGVGFKQIEDIHFVLWRTVHKLIASGNFITIYLPKFGRLRPRLNALKRYCLKLRRDNTEESVEKANHIEKQVDIIYNNKRKRND